LENEKWKTRETEFSQTSETPTFCLNFDVFTHRGVEDLYFGATFKDMGTTPIPPPSYLAEEWEKKMMDVHPPFPYHP